MGFFSDKKLGDVSTVVTIDFSFIEMWAMGIIDKVVNSILSMIIGCIFLLFLDYRVALISIVVGIVAMIIFKKVQIINKNQSAKKAEFQARRGISWWS